jgi:hypothetical protein
MVCHVCGQPAVGQCKSCAKFYCNAHGDVICERCAANGPPVRQYAAPVAKEPPKNRFYFLLVLAVVAVFFYIVAYLVIDSVMSTGMLSDGPVAGAVVLGAFIIIPFVFSYAVASAVSGMLERGKRKDAAAGAAPPAPRQNPGSRTEA